MLLDFCLPSLGCRTRRLAEAFGFCSLSASADCKTFWSTNSKITNNIISPTLGNIQKQSVGGINSWFSSDGAVWLSCPPILWVCSSACLQRKSKQSTTWTSIAKLETELARQCFWPIVLEFLCFVSQPSTGNGSVCEVFSIQEGLETIYSFCKRNATACFWIKSLMVHNSSTINGVWSAWCSHINFPQPISCKLGIVGTLWYYP